MNVSEPQSVAEVEASIKSARTSMTDEESMRKRQTEEWFGEAYESIKPPLPRFMGYLIP
ncbi:nitrate reductase [Verticillium alfalfae VaMs.102]|uniref:Nitrate reductase n=1 Tax=Verticillium alfalfae (strain VaMs.102 / ATCC MYA-4576 / FGSC 10136) TaxID=526221 RepID=C9STX7_VERA1|nr:nitrate reductase [Verticillium alfalfae VaMs.102]EEY22288.1 nitrate reductase [Verticillium alfalfae VaMs.102]